MSSSSSSTMDSSGFSQVGRYGTICLMKRQEPNTVVTAFGIDTEELTFGRDPTCGVRLYYSDVSLVHCRIVFEERKAFLIVLGANGLLVDGCEVYPNGSPSNLGAPTTIPLTNNSEFEIHGKRFRFTYPPKELRAALFATPARPSQRKLRLSMIHSAQVFSPRPSADPRENLRILKSPLKNAFKTPAKSELSTPTRNNIFSAAQTPTKYGHSSNEEEEEADDIVLVDGNHPRVVEDEKDLVILEDVEEPNSRSHSTPVQQYQPPQQLQQPPQTPARKRSLSRNTLHRAVLIRSAQRAVLQAEHAEREREEEEEEEMEVLETVASEAASESEEDDPENEAVSDANDEDGEGETDEEGEEYEEEMRGREEERDPDAQKSTWRKSLERIWPFRSSSAPVEEDDQNDASSSSDSDDDNEVPLPSVDDEEQDHEDEEQENIDVPAPLPAHPQAPATPVRRALGSFMTPQVHARTQGSSSNIFARPGQPIGPHPGPTDETEAPVGVGSGRYSLGGGEARRVIRAEQVWKVRDIVVPPAIGVAVASASRTGPGSVLVGPGAPGRSAGAAGPMPSPVRARQVVGEEERKAIQERRRSALREVDTFFGGGVPGMNASPGKPRGWSPAKTSSTSSSSIAGTSSSGTVSPFKASSPTKLTAQFKRDDDDDDAEEMMDTRSLLDRMKETVEGMKRRRSLVPTGAGTPVRVAPPVTPVHDSRMSFGRAGTVSPSKSVAPAMMEVAEEEEEGEEDDKENMAGVEEKTHDSDEENDESRKEEEVFSLLRPGVLEEVRAREEASVIEVEGELLQSIAQVDDVDIVMADEVRPEPFAVPASVEVPAHMDATSPIENIPSAEDETTADSVPKKAGRARLLRAKKSSPPLEEAIVDEPIVQTEPKSKSKTTGRKAKGPIKKTAPETEEANSDDEQSLETLVAPKSAARRGRKAAAESESEGEVVQPPARRARKAATAESEKTPIAPPARRGRKATADPEEASPKEQAAIPASVPARRGRKPATPPAVEMEETEPATAPAKRGARKATAVAEVDVAEETQPPVRRGRTPRTAPSALPVRKASTKRTAVETSGAGSGSGGVRRGAQGTPIDVEMLDGDGNDPLDSLDAEEAEAVVIKPKGRKKAVKEEVVEVGLDKIPAPATRSGKAKTPAVKTPAAKPRAKKAPATAPAAVQDVDKENTPGSEGSSIVDTDEPVKIRVSRTTKKGTSAVAARSTKVKQEETEQVEDAVAEPEAPRGRSLRATRTRTKT